MKVFDLIEAFKYVIIFLRKPLLREKSSQTKLQNRSLTSENDRQNDHPNPTPGTNTCFLMNTRYLVLFSFAEDFCSIHLADMDLGLLSYRWPVIVG